METGGVGDGMNFLDTIRDECLEKYNCIITFSRYTGTELIISQLRSLKPKQGNATRALKYVIKALCRNGIKRIEIVVMPIPGTTGPDAEKLVEWYKTFGFVVTKITVQTVEMELLLN